MTFEEDAWVKADPGKEFALDEVVDADEMGLREIPSDLARAAYVISIPRSQRPGQLEDMSAAISVFCARRRRVSQV